MALLTFQMDYYGSLDLSFSIIIIIIIVVIVIIVNIIVIAIVNIVVSLFQIHCNIRHLMNCGLSLKVSIACQH